jgi:glycosyltransferase involved in cell wall biosynthesis
LSLAEQTGSDPQSRRTQDGTELSVVIPCLNEAEAIAGVVGEARAAIEGAGIRAEIVVVDNGSTDGTAALAEEAGARVVAETNRGYGSAYRTGFAAARGTYIVMGDGDGTYDFSEIPRFVEALRDGADMVIGNRMNGLDPGSMPWLHRYIGNPLLTGTLNLFFSTHVKDAHCGLRAFRRDLLPALDLRSTGMELASEQVIRAAKLGLNVRELDIRYRRRKGESKLSSFMDGWRHLRFLLVHSPTHLFILPGAVMSVVGGLIGLLVLWQIHLFGRAWDLHTEIAGALLTIIGTQVVALGLAAHAYGKYFMGERDPWFDRMRQRYKLEHGLLLGGGLALGGFILGAVIVIEWFARDFAALSEQRLAVAAATLLIVGMQIFFSSFLLSILGLRRDDR